MREAILDVLSRLQAAYEQKESWQVSSVVEDIFTKDAVYCGTSTRESCRGHAEITRQLLADWLHWGTPRFDYATADVAVSGRNASVLATGTLRWMISIDALLEKTLSHVADILDKETAPQMRLLEIASVCNRALLAHERGERHILPLRVQASLVEDDKHWRIKHLTISHPTGIRTDSDPNGEGLRELY